MYTLDTNAIIYFLKGDRAAVRVMEPLLRQKGIAYVSTVTELELFSFQQLDSTEADLIEELLGSVALMPLNSRIARTAGLLRRRYRLKTADSAIAATALFTGSALVTRNVKDFHSVAGLLLIAV